MYRPALSDPGDSHIALCILDYLESLLRWRTGRVQPGRKFW